MTVLELVESRCGEDAEEVARMLGLTAQPQSDAPPAPTANAERNRRYRERKRNDRRV